MSRNKGLFKCYNDAGPNFLAFRLGRLFTKIESEEERVLHNDILADVLQIIEGEEKTFFMGIAETLLYQKYPKKKRFLFRMAERVLRTGHTKG